jgi:Sap-like sulfolipid-1-addressing protein
VGKVVLYACTAALYPTLLAATTVMLMLDHPRRLLLGYLLGALTTSITLGLVIVFSLQDSGTPDAAKNTLSPAMNLALGLIALAVAYALRPRESEEPKPEGRVRQWRERRKEAKEEKGPPKWQQTLSKGSARTTFVAGAILTLPGGSYILGLHAMAGQDLSTAATVGLVLAFNAVMLILLELPLVAYTVAPDWTPDAIERFKGWLSANGRRIGIRVAVVLGLLLIARGVIELL